MHSRLAASHFLVAGTALVMVALLLPRAVEQNVITRLEQQLADEARLVRRLATPFLISPAPRQLQALTQQIGRDVGARVTVIDPHGRVLADSLQDPRTMENHASRPEIREALRAGLDQSRRYSRALARGRLYVAVPVWRGQGSGGAPPRSGGPGQGGVFSGPSPLGVVRLSLSLGEVHQYVGQLRHALLAGLVLAGLAAVGVGLLLTRSLSRPLRLLRDVALGLAQGDLTQRSLLRSRDEIGELAQAFDQMATRLQETVAALAQDRSQMRTVVDTMADGLLVADANARVRLINPAAAALLGVTVADAPGKTVLDLTLDAPLQALVEEVLRTGTAAASERSLRTPAEHVVAVSAVPIGGEETGDPPDLPSGAVPLRGGAGRETGVPAFGRGTSEALEHGRAAWSRVPGQLELPSSVSRLPSPKGVVLVLHDLSAARRVERIRRDFVANASHELRTPLASMKVMVETLLRGAREDPEASERFLQILDRELDRMTALVNDLLELSRLDARVEAAPLEAVALAPLAAELEAGWQAVARGRGLELEVTIPEGLVVRGEAKGVRQILTNLLDNALKYTPAGGRVRVSARRAGAQVLLEVADTGIGIPVADRDRIFERFYRVDKDRSRDVGGTGLGLSIVKHLVQAYGGTITVESRLNRGSTFRVIFPLAGDAEPPERPAAAAAEIRPPSVAPSSEPEGSPAASHPGD